MLAKVEKWLFWGFASLFIIALFNRELTPFGTDLRFIVLAIGGVLGAVNVLNVLGGKRSWRQAISGADKLVIGFFVSKCCLAMERTIDAPAAIHGGAVCLYLSLNSVSVNGSKQTLYIMAGDELFVAGFGFGIANQYAYFLRWPRPEDVRQQLSWRLH